MKLSSNSVKTPAFIRNLRRNAKALVSAAAITACPSKYGKKKVLILMSDTGGGHRASAQAIDQALKEIYPGKLDVDIVDIWTDYARWPFNGFVQNYRFLAKHPSLWRMTYAYGRFPPTRFASETVSAIACTNRFRRAIERSDPDIVVSVHPLCQHICIPIIKKMNEKRPQGRSSIPFAIVVTDLGGAHETWFHKGADVIFVPTNAVRKIALKAGISRSKITQHGLPVRPAFWTAPESKSKLRNKLNLKQGINTVLLMGGGDGVGGLIPIATELGRKLSTCKENTQMVVICGHNKKVTQQLRKAPRFPKVSMRVLGFCNNVHQYMGASDCLITKAGPGTIAEAMTRGLPIILSSYLPGQEQGNVPYVVNGGFGMYSGNRPKLVAEHVFKLFSSEILLKSMSANSLMQSSPMATWAISKDIGALVLKASYPSKKYYDRNSKSYRHGIVR